MKDTYLLIDAAQQGDKQALSKLTADNSKLVWSVVKRFCGRGCEAEDLYQIGQIGLIKAIYRFDTKRELALSTYAVPMIMGEIRRHLRDDGMIHISRSLRETAIAAKSAALSLADALGREPTLSEIAKATGKTSEELAEASEAAQPVLSIYQPLSNDKSLADVIADTVTAEDCLDKILVKQIIASADDNMRTLLNYRFYHGMTQSQAAKILGMSQVAVSRAEKKFFTQMRNEFSPQKEALTPN